MRSIVLLFVHNAALYYLSHPVLLCFLRRNLCHRSVSHCLALQCLVLHGVVSYCIVLCCVFSAPCLEPVVSHKGFGVLPSHLPTSLVDHASMSQASHRYEGPNSVCGACSDAHFGGAATACVSSPRDWALSMGSALHNEQQRKGQRLTMTSARLPSDGPDASMATACGHRLWDWVFHMARVSSRLTVHETVWEFFNSRSCDSTPKLTSVMNSQHSSPMPSSSSMSAHLGLTAARISCRLVSSDPEIPHKTTVIWSAQQGFVRMPAGLLTPATFLMINDHLHPGPKDTITATCFATLFRARSTTTQGTNHIHSRQVFALLAVFLSSR